MTPEKYLALEVLKVAVEDAKRLARKPVSVSRSTVPQGRKQMQAFLAGEGDESNLDFWCEVAEVNPDAFRERLRGLMSAWEPLWA